MLEGAAICDQNVNGETFYLVKRVQDKQIKIVNSDNSRDCKSDEELRFYITYPT
jgi:hypothetical protein